MYGNFYHLKLDPFADAPDPHFLFWSPSHKAALHAIRRGVAGYQGIGVISGDVGLGKTTILRASQESLEPQHYTVIRPFYPKLSLQDLLKIIGQECGLASVPDDLQAARHQLSQVLLAAYNNGRRVVLILDEAQELPVPTLAGLTLLAHMRAPTGEHLLQIVLAGLPALHRALRLPALRALKKRLAYCVTLAPLNAAESLAYVQHRLAKAFAFEDELFTPGALKQIIRYAQGNPRVLNNLCSDALITGELQQQPRVSPAIVREVMARHSSQRGSLLWRWGAVTAAALLLVAGLEWGGQFTALLSHTFRAPLAELQSEPAGRAIPPRVVTASLAPVAQSWEPRSDVLMTPGPFEASLPQPLLSQELPSVQQDVPSPASTFEQVAALWMPPAAVVPLEAEQLPSPPVAQSVPLPQPSAPALPPEPEQTSNNAAPKKAPSRALSGGTSVPVAPKSSVASSHATVKRQTPLAAVPPPASGQPQEPARRMPRVPEPTVQQAHEPVVVPEREAAPVLQVALAPPEPIRAPESPVIRSAARADMARAPEGGLNEMSQASPPPGGSSLVETSKALRNDGLVQVDASRFVVETGGHMAIIRELIFTADGRELISAGDDKAIRVWSVSPDGRRATLARTIRGPSGVGREGMLAAAALSPPDTAGHQRWLAVGGYLPDAPPDRYAIRLHDYASGEIVGLLRGHTDAILALAFSPTGRWLASAGKDLTVRMWDLGAFQGNAGPKTSLVHTAHTDHIYDLAWSSTGHRLASASYDGTVGLWNTEALAQNTLTLIGRLQGHDDQVLTVAFHPEGSVLASGGKDRTIRTWQASDGTSLGVFVKAKHKVSALAFSPNGELLLAGNFSPPRPDQLTLFAYPTGKVHQTFAGHHNLVIATAFHPSGQWVASGGGEQKEILLWHAHTGETLSRLEGRGRTVYAVGFSRDGRYLSWGHTPGAASANKPLQLEYHFDLAQLVRLSGGLPDAAVVRPQEQVGALRLVTESGGSYNYPYRLHIQRDAQRLGTVERGHTDGYRHSAYTFTPDAQSVLSGGMNGVLGLYTLDGQVRAELIGHTGEIKAVAVSADGLWAVSGANDQTLRLWSLHDLPLSGNTQRLPTLTIFAAIDGEWVAWTPAGFFAASPQGGQLLGYSIDQGLDKIATYVPAEQLRDRFYRPALIQATLQNAKPLYNTARQ